MHASLFSLVSADNSDVVFAWGMEIVIDEDSDTGEEDRTAVVYIGTPKGEKTQIATHGSAEAACARWSHILPLSVVWEADAWAQVYGEINNSTIITN